MCEDCDLIESRNDEPEFDAESCQFCDSDDVEWNRTERVYICNDCGRAQ